MPDKPAADIENSAVYKMIKESESSGKSSAPLTPDRECAPRKQGLSFLLLQSLYDNEMEENKTEPNLECNISIYILLYGLDLYSCCLALEVL